jgi:hypothetical protein
MKSALFFLCFTLGFFSFVSAQNFYDRAVVQQIEIFFGFTNWDAQLDAANLTDVYIVADSVRINGVVFDSVGVKYKGNSSYSPNNNKNPLHLKLDYIKGSQDYQTFTDIKLQNGYQDPSMIREVLSYAILEQYMDCPEANFANVYINGTLRGVYSNAETIDDNFNSAHYYDNDGSFFKCNPVGGAGPGSTSSPDLKYISADTTAYYSGYELKSTNGWTDLMGMITTLNNDFANIETKLDIDRAIWMLAFNNVLVNLDSYSGAFRQNYYLYRDLNDRFITTVWDLNMSFAGFPGGTGSGAYTATTLDPLSNSTSTIHPLIVKIMANPMFKRMYMAHVRTIVQEIFASGAYLTTANTLRSTIDSYVQADPFKFYTYTQYQNSLTTAVAGGGPAGSSTPGIQALMTSRVAFFNTNANYILVAPAISSYAASNPTPSLNQNFFITASCSNESLVFLGYRTSHPLKFNRVQMFDDGAHGDGSAGDHVYGVQVTANGVIFEYYIYAENSVAGLFSPQRAEHEFHTLVMNIPFPQVGEVVVNELMANNVQTAVDNYGENNDWIELYNTTSHAVDLTGLYLSDDIALYTKWAFPVNSVILPNSYLIVWADNDPSQIGLHTNFKLSSNGESLFFSNGVNLYDQVSFSLQSADISYARCPDAGIFAFAAPTFNATNNCFAGISEKSSMELSIFPVPFQESFTLKVTHEDTYELMVTDMQGRKILSTVFNALDVQINSEQWKAGIYLLSIKNSKEETQTMNILKY